ncbi:MAG: hypothetical protein GQ559_09895 [Desulfobulbaceae bacterium]|nr:hypothetical protein [Desulfobulbaceae bacterium]
MNSLREKITFILTALAYLLFHLRMGPGAGAILMGTFGQMLTTAPYAIGFTYILVAVIRYRSDGRWPPWDRIFRIFFTIGIMFAFFFALYEYGDRTEQQRKQLEEKAPIESLFFQDDTRKARSYWA